jgi:hypothetical protein
MFELIKALIDQAEKKIEEIIKQLYVLEFEQQY